MLVVLVVLLVLVVLFFLLRPAAPPGTDSEQEEEEREAIALAIDGRTMTPEEVKVSEGNRVDLKITSERPVELHLHGYDLEEEEVEPGEPAEISFEADKAGRFPIEDHSTGAELGALLVQPL